MLFQHTWGWRVGRRSSRSYIISGKYCSKYSLTHVSHVGGKKETSILKRPLCAKYLSDIVVGKAKRYLPRKTSAGEALEMCLWAFETRGTTRCRVPKLFARLRMDEGYENCRRHFRNPVRHTGNQGSDHCTPLMAAIE